jgi:hypothetical protein
MDFVGIQPGENFRTVLAERMDSAEAVLVVVGDAWLTAKDARGRRLADRDNFVRIEVASALKRDIRVIPVLVKDAKMPQRAELPRSIAALASQQAVRLAADHWRQDVDELIRVLEKARKPRVPPWSVEVKEDFRIPSDAEREANVSAYWAEILAGTWNVQVTHGSAVTAQGQLAIAEKGPFHGRMLRGRWFTVAGRLRFELPDQLVLEGEGNDGVTSFPYRWAFEVRPGSPTRLLGTEPDGGQVVWWRTG